MNRIGVRLLAAAVALTLVPSWNLSAAPNNKPLPSTSSPALPAVAAEHPTAADDGTWSDLEDWLRSLRPDTAARTSVKVESFEHLSDIARASHMHALVTAANRRIAGVEIATDQVIDVTEPGPILEHFFSQKEFPFTLPLPASYEEIAAVDGRLRSTFPGPAPASTSWIIRPEDYDRALAADDPSLRWFAMTQLQEEMDVVPMHAVLQALLIENELPLRRLAVSLLEQERYMKAWDPTRAAEPGVAAGIRELELNSPTDDDRLDALFLRVWYGGGGGEAISYETIFHLFQRGVPAAWFEYLFRVSPPDVRRHFTVHVLRGLGHNTPLILEVLGRFTDDPVILEQLSIVLVNRHARPLAPVRAQIIEIWEELTGIPYEGSDQPYREWYVSRRPSEQ